MSEHPAADAAETIVRFFRFLDEQDYEALVGLLSEDAVWVRLNRPLNGQKEVLAALSQRDPARATCHVLTNFTVDRAPEGCRVSALMLNAHGPRDDDGIALFDGLAAIRRLEAELVSEPSGLKISGLRDRLIFKRADH